MFAAPPGTDRTIRSICAASNSTSGSICGVIASHPAGIRFGGTTNCSIASLVNALARSANVGLSKTRRISADSPTRRNRSFSCTISSECPPSSKKLSRRPTRSTRSNDCQIPARISSTSPCGASYCRLAYAPSSGAGNARRSSFPFGVSGKLSSITNAPGTMCSGSTDFRCARNPSAPGDCAASFGTTYATRRFSPGRSSRAITTASLTPSCRPSCASISPSSIRNPRIFT